MQAQAEADMEGQTMEEEHQIKEAVLFLHSMNITPEIYTTIYSKIVAEEANNKKEINTKQTDSDPIF